MVARIRQAKSAGQEVSRKHMSCPSPPHVTPSPPCEVILVGESQGGHVASVIALLTSPDLLVLLCSLPDRPDVARLRQTGQITSVAFVVTCFRCHSAHAHDTHCCAQTLERYFGGMPEAENTVQSLGPDAFLAEFWGYHCKINQRKVRRHRFPSPWGAPRITAACNAVSLISR